MAPPGARWSQEAPGVDVDEDPNAAALRFTEEAPAGVEPPAEAGEVPSAEHHLVAPSTHQSPERRRDRPEHVDGAGVVRIAVRRRELPRGPGDLGGAPVGGVAVEVIAAAADG